MEGGTVALADFIDTKGWKAIGNRLSDQKLLDVKEVIEKKEPKNTPSVSEDSTETKADNASRYQAGDTIEFDFG